MLSGLMLSIIRKKGVMKLQIEILLLACGIMIVFHVLREGIKRSPASPRSDVCPRCQTGDRSTSANTSVRRHPEGSKGASPGHVRHRRKIASCPIVNGKHMLQRLVGFRLWTVTNDPNMGVPLWKRPSTKMSSEIPIELAMFPKWALVFLGTRKVTRSTNERFEKTFVWRQPNELSNYKDMYNFFMYNSTGAPCSYMKDRIWQLLPNNDPRLSEAKRLWRDDIFAIQRLVGNNPKTLTRLVAKRATSADGLPWDDLKKKLNATFNFKSAVEVTMPAGRNFSFEELLSDGRLFVQHYPLLSRVTADDTAPGAFKSKTMVEPIVLFILPPGENLPRPVAIQLSINSSSLPVYTPRSGFFWWTMAKLFANQADAINSQIVQHLVACHFAGEVFAVATLRELSTAHPIRELLRSHFDGLLGINTAGLSLLVNQKGLVASIAGFGFEGLKSYARSAYEEWRFDSDDFLLDLAARGVANTTALPYYPYRDDGLKLYNLLRNFVNDYVGIFYCSDESVAEDRELQSWISFSAKHHKNKGVPRSLKTRNHLRQVLLKIIWTNSAGHASVNYPVKEWVSLVALTPLSIHMHPDQVDADKAAATSPEHPEYLLKLLPSSEKTQEQVLAATQLSALKLSPLLRYDHVDNPSVMFLIKMYSKRLEHLQREIEALNTERQRQGLFAYRYLQPNEVPANIAI